MSPYTKGVAISNAKLKRMHFSHATSRLDFTKFHLKRVNRPTTETQPQKKHGNRKPKLVLLEGGSKKSELRLSVTTGNPSLLNRFETDRIDRGAVKVL